MFFGGESLDASAVHARDQLFVERPRGNIGSHAVRGASAQATDDLDGGAFGKAISVPNIDGTCLQRGTAHGRRYDVARRRLESFAGQTIVCRRNVDETRRHIHEAGANRRVDGSDGDSENYADG